jgi:pimeloyl-ACP methyl ester carboxylesterase
MRRTFAPRLVAWTLAATSMAAQPLIGQVTTPPEFRYVEVPGVILAYRDLGVGEPLLLLHGFGASGEIWAPFLDTLSSHFRVIVPDLRGHGRSTNPDGEFTHRQAARDVAALLDSLGIVRVKAMGISTGGMTLLHLATSMAERVEAMVLIGATSYFPEQAREIMRRSHPDSMSAQELERAASMHAGGAAQARALRAQFHAFKDSYDDMNFTAPLLSTIRARTLIVHGDRDVFFPVEIPLEQYRAIPHSYLWIVPNGGHVPLGTARRTEFLRIAFLFLSGAWN